MMNFKYKIKKFDLSGLSEFSSKQVEAHLGLYAGYVNNTNKLIVKIAELGEDEDKNAYAIESIRRRFAFEFNGMRLHELYFSQFSEFNCSQHVNSKNNEDKSQNMMCGLSTELGNILNTKYGSIESFIAHIKKVALSRGVGWTVVVYDEQEKQIHTLWVSDHELGMLSDVKLLAVVDMWEHAFMVDYLPSEKTKYIDIILANINWKIISERFSNNS